MSVSDSFEMVTGVNGRKLNNGKGKVVRVPYIIHSAVYILFWSFEISDYILRNQKLMFRLIF